MAVIAWVMRQYEEYQALPAPVRQWIIRVGHGLIQFGGVIATTMTLLDVSFWAALLPALVSLITGQQALHKQMPRDPTKFVHSDDERHGG